jgi:hypothetical protein
MAPELRTLFSRLAALALTVLALTLVSCSSVSVGPGGQISKVKYYFMESAKPVKTNDVAIRFEREYHLYGAVTKQEILARTGHYYTIFWKANDRTQPVTVRFEYRQANSGLTSKVIEQSVSDVRKSNISKFEVIGDQYTTNGRVTAWRVSLLRGKEELASQESYLWN